MWRARARLPFCFGPENGPLLPFFAGRLRRPAHDFYHFGMLILAEKSHFFRRPAGGTGAFTILLRFYLRGTGAFTILLVSRAKKIHGTKNRSMTQNATLNQIASRVPRSARCARAAQPTHTPAVATRLKERVAQALRRRHALVPHHAMCSACHAHHASAQLLGGLLASDLSSRRRENLERQSDAASRPLVELRRLGTLGVEHLGPEAPAGEVHADVRLVDDADGVGVATVSGTHMAQRSRGGLAAGGSERRARSGSERGAGPSLPWAAEDALLELLRSRVFALLLLVEEPRLLRALPLLQALRLLHYVVVAQAPVGYYTASQCTFNIDNVLFGRSQRDIINR